MLKKYCFSFIFLKFLYVLFIVFLIGCGTTKYYDVITEKNGKEHIGKAFVDTTTKAIMTKTKSGSKEVISFDSVDYISSYNQVLYPPLRFKVAANKYGLVPYDSVQHPVVYNLLYPDNQGFSFGNFDIVPSFDCMRSFSFYFWELRAALYKAEKIYFGAEGDIGFRLGNYSAGIGLSLLSMRSSIRTPLFLHLKYQFSMKCFNPFLFIDVGYPFDSYTSKYKVNPSLSYITKLGQKMAGLGAGFDIAITQTLDLSFDAGFRYFTLANERPAPSCDGTPGIAYDEIYSGFLRIGVTF